MSFAPVQVTAMKAESLPVLGFWKDSDSLVPTQAIADTWSSPLIESLRSSDLFPSQKGEMLTVPPSADWPKGMVLLHLGTRAERTPEGIGALVRATVAKLRKAPSLLFGATDWFGDDRKVGAGLFAQNVVRALAPKVNYKKDAEVPQCPEVLWLSDTDESKALAEGATIGSAIVAMCRLADTPANLCTPAFLCEEARNIAKNHEKVSATILERRGLEKAEDAVYYLETDTIYQHSPFECEDVYTAVDRISQAIEEGERILIFGDRDVDGVTGAAILFRGLRKLGAKDVTVRLPEGDEPYGLTADTVAEIFSHEYSLVITVDNGISAVEEIRELERNGVDVVVLDHHIPGDELPGAVALFDPRIGGSGYPFSSLAGCAVAAKMIWALEFSRTPLYGSECIVLHAEPRNGSVRINAVRLENLIEIDRMGRLNLSYIDAQPDAGKDEKKESVA